MTGKVTVTGTLTSHWSLHMFQSFDVISDASKGASRVAALRGIFTKLGVDGVIVPRSDEHQGEYVAKRSERLAWLTGFTGSAGAAVVLTDKAIIFVDGRYTEQVTSQVDGTVFTIESLISNPPAKWAKDGIAAGTRLGFDPWLHTITEIQALRKAVETTGGTLVALERNPVDLIWEDQPPPPLESVDIHPVQWAGREAKDKLADLAAAVADVSADFTVLTDPSSIAWAFNIRGNDVPHTPLMLGFAIIAASGVHLLFVDKRKLPMQTEAYLTQLADLCPPSSLVDRLADLARDGRTIALDPGLAAERFRSLVEDNGGSHVALADPARLPRSTKNIREIEGTRAAHLRDAAAMISFLAWLDAQQAGSVDEITAVRKLENDRRAIGEKMQMPLRDISFETISGSGPNGAVIHYRVSTASNRHLEPGELYLVDSGAQYQDGTTDITRTIPIGTPTEEMRDRYTRVLKGMITISMLRFPAGTRGMDIDVVARQALWQAGLDYAHGTGHGVGSYLSVHEGPQRIARTGSQALLAGMILSNEPGYYKPGQFGIRLENLILVGEASPVKGGDIDMHDFETLTRVPFDRRLICTDLLTAAEKDWLNSYHDKVVSDVATLVDAEASEWLKTATAPL